jgi:NAD(P)-dependent dehydrogenase (short-subunit alcohol dehydrogenase family)
MPTFSIADIPSQAGKLAIVTGTGGLGYETALALAGAGAEVILAGRNEEKGRDAVRKIAALTPGERVRFERVDLADLRSVAAFADRLLTADRAIDMLINNAGVMMPPVRQATADGFELQFGTNYLSHFALTARLLPLLRKRGGARVVSVSSGAHRMGGAIHFDDLQWERSYKPWPAYAQSKLALLMFALELDRRSIAHGWRIMSTGAHPGYARTELIANGPGTTSMMARVSGLFGLFFSQSAAAGAMPTLFAATSPDARGGGYYGPDGFFEMKGATTAAVIGTNARDSGVARRLWEVSEQLTQVHWPAAEMVPV